MSFYWFIGYSLSESGGTIPKSDYPNNRIFESDQTRQTNRTAENLKQLVVNSGRRRLFFFLIIFSIFFVLFYSFLFTLLYFLSLVQSGGDQTATFEMFALPLIFDRLG